MSIANSMNWAAKAMLTRREEQTVYYATVLPKFQDRIVDLLTDMMRPKLEESEFETERKVILEEIAKYEDQPPFGAFERALEVYFGPRGLGRRVLGTSESIESMKCEAMRTYFQRRYRPENMVLAASGNVDFDGLVEQVEKLSATWNSEPMPKIPTADDEKTIPVGVSVDRNLEIPDAHQAYLIRMSAGPSAACDDRFATRALAAVVGDEGGSRLFWELIDTGKAEVATVWPQEFMDTGAWFTYLVCDPADIQSNAKLIDDVFARVIADGVQKEELDQAINKATAGLIMQSERPSNRLFGLGSRWLTHREYFSTDDMLDRLKSLEVDAVSAAAKNTLEGTQSRFWRPRRNRRRPTFTHHLRHQPHRLRGSTSAGFLAMDRSPIALAVGRYPWQAEALRSPRHSPHPPRRVRQ